MKAAKEYTVISRRYRFGGEAIESRYTGTIEHLVNNVFGYTLKCGKSWEFEKGNKKINDHPTTIKSLITNLNNAESNRAKNGCASTYYELAED